MVGDHQHPHGHRRAAWATAAISSSAGGRVVDGTGEPARRADVRVADGRIAEIGPGLRGERALDADGAFVAPGFVDIHTHYDAQVFWDPWLTPSSLQGVTTVVAGHCGLSLAPCRGRGATSMVRTLHFVEDMAPATLARRASTGRGRTSPRTASASASTAWA